MGARRYCTHSLLYTASIRLSRKKLKPVKPLLKCPLVYLDKNVPLVEIGKMVPGGVLEGSPAPRFLRRQAERKHPSRRGVRPPISLAGAATRNVVSALVRAGRAHLKMARWPLRKANA